MAYDGAGWDQILQEAGDEQARLAEELEEQRSRANAADERRRQVEDRVRAAYVDLSEAARVELESIDAEWAALVAAIRAEALAQAEAVRTTANRTAPPSGGHPVEGS